MTTLRPDQERLRVGAYEAWQSVRNVLLVQPTGGGKSVIVRRIVAELNASRSTATIAHRQELVGQMSLHLGREAVRHRIIAPRDVVAQITALHRTEFGRSFVEATARAGVIGVDTLLARSEQLKEWCQQVGQWTIDEAHHVLRSNKWGKAVSLFPNAYGLGVTATPERADGNGIGRDHDGVFDKMIVGPTMRELIDIGALSEYQIVVPASDFNRDGLSVGTNGDYTFPAMREASRQSHIVGDVVKNYVLYANGKTGITFATDVETAGEMAQRFNEAGIPAVSVSAKTDGTLRDEYIRRFRSGDLKMLVNVDLFGEGFDLPAIEVVIMARPTASLGVYLQQFGRALRILAGKLYGLVIDHVSNVRRFGLPDRPRVWTMARREKRSKASRDDDDIPVKVCRNVPACGRAYSGLLRVCPYCGFEPVPVGSGRSVAEVDGDLMLLDVAALDALRKSAILASPAQMQAQAGYAHGPLAGAGQFNRQVERIEAQRRLADTIAAWAGYQQAAGISDAESYRRFYFKLGVDVVSALGLPRVEMDAATEKINGWINDENH